MMIIRRRYCKSVPHVRILRMLANPSPHFVPELLQFCLLDRFGQSLGLYSHRAINIRGHCWIDFSQNFSFEQSVERLHFVVSFVAHTLPHNSWHLVVRGRFECVQLQAVFDIGHTAVEYLGYYARLVPVE